MDMKKLSVKDEVEGNEEEDGNETEVYITKMAHVFRTPEYDTPDALPLASTAPVIPIHRSESEHSKSRATNTSEATGIKVEPEAVSGEEEPERYNMQHKRRGVALIFNHETFEEQDLRKREGAGMDGQALVEALEKLSFDVRYYLDLTLSELKKTLRDVAMEDHKDADCLFVAVMTHGEKGDLLHAKDLPLKVEDIWRPFTADRVMSLAGKPKIFLIQACRGRKVENPVWLSDATDSMPSEGNFSIPTRADFLFAHSSMEGYYSWRNPDEGSWFVQDFCKELEKNGRRRDLLTIMTLTLNRVAYYRKSYAPFRKDLHEKKQMPIFSSTLTKLVYFDSTAV